MKTKKTNKTTFAIIVLLALTIIIISVTNINIGKIHLKDKSLTDKIELAEKRIN